MAHGGIPSNISASHATTVSQMLEASTQPQSRHTMMGGRNEQANFCQGQGQGYNQYWYQVSTIQTRCRVGQVNQAPIVPPQNTKVNNECDTNADTTCLGKNFVILHFTTRTADVFPYDKSYQPMENVPIVSGATAYDNERTGQTYILVINICLEYLLVSCLNHYYFSIFLVDQVDVINIFGESLLCILVINWSI